jgi:hypothetical protein
MKELIANIYAQAKQLNACDKFTGKEQTLEDIVKLFKSPQGIEFCLKNYFPSTTTLRMFKQYDTAKYDIYIDAGNITLNNPRKAIIIGHTTATINCSGVKERHEIVAMRGAKVIVNARDWAVVSCNGDSGCSWIKNTSSNAIII